MRIKKLLIKNFKNIKDTVVIDFDKDISLFVGPNGFGKTTIFDAIELALTGTIYRISNTKIVDGRSTFKQAYFQNDISSDVIIKLLLCNDKDEYLTIVRWYNNNSTGSHREMSPLNSLLQFKLLADRKDDFTDISNISGLELINQKIIDEFIGFHDINYKIKNIYNLFNYIQQEDTAYYLRKNENSRKETLNFLLQIQDYQDKKAKLGDLRNQFNRVKENLLTQKERYAQNHFFNTVNYERLPLFSRKDLKLNNEEIDFGHELSSDSLNSYLNEVDKLINFKENFSPNEFFKKQQRIRFQREILDNEELLNYIIFQKLISESHDAKRIIDNHLLLTNINNYSFYLLENFIEQIDLLEKQITRKSNLQQLKQHINLSIDTIDIKTITKLLDELGMNDFTEKWLEQFTDNFYNYFSKRDKLAITKKDYSHLNNLRNQIKTHILPDDVNHSQCALCGFDWKKRELLKEQYDIIDRVVESNMSSLEKDTSSLQTKLNQDIKALIEKILEEDRKLIIVDVDLINELKLIEINDQFTEFNKIAGSITSVSPFKFGAIDFQLYNQEKERLKSIAKDKLFIPTELCNTFIFSKQNQEKFESILLQYSIIDNSFLVKHQLSNEMFPISIEVFNSIKENLKRNLNSLLTSINYDTLKSNDFDNIFSRYFDNKKDIFDLCTREKLISKKEYLKFKFEQKKSVKLSKIDSRLTIIQQSYNYLDERNNELDRNLKQYQHQMIHMLKLPFFLYTAKILQNYQQGMGVLLTTHEGNSNIRFLTNSYSEQDAMYQLSSGQIAVISFAFTLALNKTFKISDDLKILAIDDPIQDMDAMNVYALIDLLRHSLPDYQIIMSTHSDSSAMFIKYKFDLMSTEPEGKVNIINAKSLFLKGSK